MAPANRDAPAAVTEPGSPLRVDEARIIATVRAYATAIDRRDVDLLRALVTDPVHIDFTSYDPSRTAISVSPGGWIEGLTPQLIGLDATLHTISNPLISVNGARATCTSDVRADHILATDDGEWIYTLGGHYTDVLVDDGAGWRISSKTITVDWEHGDREIMRVARRRGEALLEAIGS